MNNFKLEMLKEGKNKMCNEKKILICFLKVFRTKAIIFEDIFFGFLWRSTPMKLSLIKHLTMRSNNFIPSNSCKLVDEENFGQKNYELFFSTL